MVKLSQLVNLGVLTVDRGVLCPEFGLEDSMVKAWERTAVELGAFSMLRALVFREQKDLSPRVFSYLQGFPGLALLILEDCSVGIKDTDIAIKAGWKYKYGRTLNNTSPETDGVDKAWNSVTHTIFRTAGAISSKRATVGSEDLQDSTMAADQVEAVNFLPVLHFSLGGNPRDAGLAANRNHKLQCFERAIGWMNSTMKSERVLKRPIDGLSPPSRSSKRTPVIRVSKQRDVNRWLAELI